MKFPAVFCSASLIALSLVSGANAEPVFNRIASFPVSSNLAAGMDAGKPTSAEIIAASSDGMLLAYSDSPAGGVGFIDIADPANPKPAGYVKLEGEPTSVHAAGNKLLVSVNTSKNKVETAGQLISMDFVSRAIASTCDLGGQPDSIAVSPDQSIAAVAIENERDEEVSDGDIPQMPAGFVMIYALNDGVADCASAKKVDLTGLATVAPDDPEPEYIDINHQNEIAVTLQENNHIVLIDGKSGKVIRHFSAGTVDLHGVDTKSEGAISFTGSKEGVAREPDTVQWIDSGRFLVANEGDWKGGSRSFTIFSESGKVLHESGLDLEYRAAAAGHYPEKRSKSKGIEPEGADVRSFGKDRYIFVMAERASLIGVYRDTGNEPEFKQLLPAGLSPEGIISIPQRNLLAVANEVDLVEDGGVRSHVTIYNYAEGKASYPTIVSNMDADGKPMGWGALSGLTADPEKPGILYAVSDSIYAMQPTIYTIDATQSPARIVAALPVLRAGQPAQLMDMEGIAADGKGGFWVASEGRADTMVPHGILHVTAKGEIDKAIGLPESLSHAEKRFGFEGITIVGSGDDMTLWMAVQREWSDDKKGFTKLVSYNPKSKEWGGVLYPLDAAADGAWMGLSEITAHGEHAYIVERDNQIGAAAKVKKIYRVALASMKSGKLGEALPVVNKDEVRDLIPDMKKSGGYVLDKVEGFTIDKDGTGFVVTDNDGVDDSNGETLFWSIGKM